MGNTLLTSDIITRKALQVLHAKLNFIGSINRSYDDQFANDGGKIGESLRIRLPNKYTVRTGKTINVQDTTNQSVTLTVATQKGVDMNFSSRELTMSIDDFTERHIEPAMSVLASNIEADALTMALDVYNMVGTVGTTPASMVPFLAAKTKLNQYLAPMDEKRTALITSATSGAMVEGLKTLFQDSAQLAAQYRDGIMGRTSGFLFGENDLLPVLTTGTRTGSITVDGAAPTGSTINLKALGSGTSIAKGEVFTIDGYYAVHPETKQPYSHLQQFVVTETAAASGTTITGLKIAPEIVTSGAYQNVYGTPATDAVVTLKGGAATGGAAASAGASGLIQQNLCFHKNAFAFVTADLEMPKGVDFAARKVIDGISMRVVRQYDINNDNMPCRLDVFYGYKTIRPELAVRVTG